MQEPKFITGFVTKMYFYNCSKFLLITDVHSA